MDKETEKSVRQIVKEESREETALIMVNIGQMNRLIDTLGETLKELEETLRRKKA